MTSNLDKQIKTSHRIISLRTFIYKSSNIKGHIINSLPFSSKVKVTKFNDNWCKIKLNHKNLYGYVVKSHLINKQNYINDWIDLVDMFLNTPYRWGGRSSISLDCSALSQLVLENAGFDIPRNSSEQLFVEGDDNITLKKLSRGCLIFWDGHFAITCDKSNIIHASSYHMRVVKENLKQAIKRIHNVASPIKKIKKLNLKSFIIK